jgi:hypothetical protein
MPNVDIQYWITKKFFIYIFFLYIYFHYNSHICVPFGRERILSIPKWNGEEPISPLLKGKMVFF